MKTYPPRFLLSLLFAAQLCVLVALQTRASGQTPAGQMPPSAYKLIEIRTRGSKRFTQEQIAASCGLRFGVTVGNDDFHKAARQLGESGAFSDVSYTYSYSPAGTKLLFQVADADKFVPAHFEDFVWFSDDDLLQKVHERVPLFNGELPITGRLPDEVSDVLQALLVENAVPGHVDYLRINGSNGKIESINYAVLGVTILIHSVAFTGAGASELPLLQAEAERLSNHEYARVSLASLVGRSLLPIFHERGYLKAAIVPAAPKVLKPPASETDSNRNETFVDITLAVTPGPQYKLSRVDWSGNKEFSTDTLQPLLHLKIGQPANMEQLTEDLKQVQELYGSHGYVTAGIKATTVFDDAAGTVAYQLDVHEGYVFHMGDLEFRGLDNSLTARLRAAWKLRPGDVYDATYLKEYLPLARKLLTANLDWDVVDHVTANTRDKTVDVDLQYTARAPK
jgi:outer membrane protein insertion porin family